MFTRHKKIALALLCVASFCGADEIYLKSGLVVKGELVLKTPKDVNAESRKLYRVISPDGFEEFYSMEKIDKIVDIDSPSLENGELNPNYMPGNKNGGFMSRLVPKEVLPPNGGRLIATMGHCESQTMGSYNLKLYSAAPTYAYKGDNLYPMILDNYTCGITGSRYGSLENTIVADLLPDDGRKEIVLTFRYPGTGEWISAKAFRVENGTLKLIESIESYPMFTDVVPVLAHKLNPATPGSKRWFKTVEAIIRAARGKEETLIIGSKKWMNAVSTSVFGTMKVIPPPLGSKEWIKAIGIYVLSTDMPDGYKLQSSEKPYIGTTAPALKLEHLLQAPDNAQYTWNSFKGKVVVIDFWSTWCPPCRKAIPHLNKLVNHFKNDEVVFLSITSERKEKVAKFLKNTPINTWIGIDSDSSCFSSYTVKTIPQVFIVDTTGKVAKRLSPDELTVDRIESFLKNAKVGEK